METTDRTRKALILSGLISLAVGLVPLVVNRHYLFSAGDGRVSAWLAVLAGVMAAGTGVWLLACARSSSRKQMLTQDRGRIGYVVVMSGVSGLLLIAALALEQPTVMTGVAGLLVSNCFRSLFENKDAT